jgi:hypothetical protein
MGCDISAAVKVVESLKKNLHRRDAAVPFGWVGSLPIFYHFE